MAKEQTFVLWYNNWLATWKKELTSIASQSKKAVAKEREYLKLAQRELKKARKTANNEYWIERAEKTLHYAENRTKEKEERLKSSAEFVKDQWRKHKQGALSALQVYRQILRMDYVDAIMVNKYRLSIKTKPIRFKNRRLGSFALQFDSRTPNYLAIKNLEYKTVGNFQLPGVLGKNGHICWGMYGGTINIYRDSGLFNLLVGVAIHYIENGQESGYINFKVWVKNRTRITKSKT